MNWFEIFGLLLLVAIGWLWLDSLKTRELAVSAVRAACNGDGVLLLDDTVAIARVGLGRDDEGILRLRRIYGFEFSDTGNDRNSGSIVMLGQQVLVVNLNLPHAPNYFA